MFHFAFLKEINYGIADFFAWTFQILPPIGFLMNIVLSLVVIGLLTYWTLRLNAFGNKRDKREYDYRQPHNFMDEYRKHHAHDTHHHTH
ncbi:MAG: hypothetical protein Q4F57_00160 [Weeksellaceae bacterium]|nr:hypothetical protein [Weeksellaceae bacterium]